VKVCDIRFYYYYYYVSFPLSINIFVWQNVLYFPNDFRTNLTGVTVIPACLQIAGKDSGAAQFLPQVTCIKFLVCGNK
jgi:hypothetical protein